MKSKIKSFASICLALCSLATATFAAPPTIVSSHDPTHLIASTGNLYWTENVVDDIGQVYIASVWRTGKNAKSGNERLLYREITAAHKEFGNIVFANVGTWYGYFVANDLSGNPTTYSSSIKRIPLAGGPAITVATLGRFVGNRSLRTDGSYLYWADENGIRRMPIAGGNVTTLATTTSAQHVSLGSNFVYYSDGTAIRRVLKTGGVVGYLVSSPRPITALYIYGTASGTRVLWGDAGGSVRAKTVGAAGTTIFQSALTGYRATSVGFDGTRTLWTTCRGSGGGDCSVRLQSGNTSWISLVLNGNLGVGNLQWDTSQIFWGGVGVWKRVH